MMLGDLVGYLPDDILTKVDRASMAVSLEARVPILDHRVVELAARLPLGMKIRRGSGKHILRELLARHVPRSLWERPKMGFGVPLADWLRGPLRAWAEDHLAADRLRREGVLASAAVHSCWRSFADHGRGSAHDVWDILMFQSWRERAAVAASSRPINNMETRDAS